MQAGEQLAFDSFWQIDHPTTGHDCWTTLAGLAAVTSSIRLGSLVVAAPYRSPTLLARMAADVDRMSRGRLVLGLGLGDEPQEFEALGVPFAAAAARHAILDETVRAVSALLDGTPVTMLVGEYRLTDATIGPLPPQQPRVPLLIGGGGKRTLRRAAAIADASNFGPHPLTGGVADIDDAMRRLATLDEFCAEIGRPPDTLLRSHTVHAVVIAKSKSDVRRKLDAIPNVDRFARSVVSGSPDEVVAYYRPLVAAGLRYFIAGVRGADHETLRLLSEEVVPDLQPAYIV